MVDLCKYKNMFGEPDTGAHSYRFFNIAVVDVAATVLVAYFFSWMTKFSFFYCAIALFILGIFVHRAFCVRTTVDKLVFPNANSQ
jgi:hypothetical protein